MRRPLSTALAGLAGLCALALPAAAEARGGRPVCRETSASPVLGRARCYRFGKWDSTPPFLDEAMMLSMELSWHAMDLSARSLDAIVVQKHQGTSFTSDGRAMGLGSASFVTAGLRGEMFRLGFVRLGPGFELGGTGASGARPLALHGQLYTPDTLFYATMGMSASAAFAAGPFLLRAEVFAGAKAVVLSTQQAPLPPPPAPARAALFLPMLNGGHASGPPPDGAGLSDLSARLAPRLSAEVWLDPYWTLGAYGALDAVNGTDLATGLFLRSYFSPYAGTRR